MLYNAIVTNENLTEVTLHFRTPDMVAATGTGQAVQNDTIVLTNANIASVFTDMMHNRTYPGSKLACLRQFRSLIKKIQ